MNIKKIEKKYVEKKKLLIIFINVNVLFFKVQLYL